MIDEGDHAAVRPDAWISQPSVGGIERLTHRILEPFPAVHFVHHSEGGAIGRPVSPLDVVEDFARRSTDQRHARQSPRVEERILGAAVQSEGQLAGRGHGQHIRTPGFHFLRLRTLGARGVEVDGAAFPGGAVDHRFSVGSEARRFHDAAAEGQRVVGGECDLHGAFEQQGAGGQPSQ
jgi:hypothetical protein